MATDTRTTDDLRPQLHRITPWDEGPSLGTKVIQEGMRQLSLPGQYARGLLAGKPGEKATSEEMLGRPLGPVGRFAWDVATDPLTYAGPGLVKAGGKAADLLRAGGQALGEGPAANPLVNALRKFGGGEGGALGLKFDPYQHAGEVGLERSDPEWVNQRTFYHGTATPGLKAARLDPLKTSPTGLFGRGIYTTDEAGRVVPKITTGYAEARREDALKSLRDAMQRRASQARNPWDLAQKIDAEIQRLARTTSDPQALRNRDAWDRLVQETQGHRFQGGSTEAVQSLNQAGPNYLKAMHQGQPTGDPLFYQQSLARAGLTPAGEGGSIAGQIYQGQSNYRNILDVERDLPRADFRRLKEGLLPVGKAADLAMRAAQPNRPWAFAANLKGAGETLDVLQMAQQANVRLPAQSPDLLVRSLRDLGYDALTHTGGGRTAAGQAVGPHQVVIGLDPNDVLGLGRATPYQQWQPYASLRSATAR